MKCTTHNAEAVAVCVWCGKAAYYYFLCGALMAGGAIGAWRYFPSPFLIWFCVGCAVLFIMSGCWYLWIARKSE
jgi:hypothetical protein